MTKSRSTVTIGETLSFVAELLGWLGFGRLGWWLGGTTLTRAALAFAFVVVTAAIWGMFRTRGFVPNGGEPSIAVPGPVRLSIEILFYAGALLSFFLTGWTLWGIVMALVVLVTLFFTRDRVRGLLR